MNPKQKQALADAFRAPPPVHKAAFLKRYRRRELGRGELIFIAAGSIPWWVWALSLLLGVLMLAAAAWAGPVGLEPAGLGTAWPATAGPEPGAWYAAAFTPFLALLAITENGRAQFYRMEELELACRISRRSTVLARMAVLGLFHLLLLGTLAPALAVRGAVSAANAASAAGAVSTAGTAEAVGAANAAAAGAVNVESAMGAAGTVSAAGTFGAASALGAIQAGMHLLVPYLLTAALGMELARRFHGREGLLACAAAAVLVCGMGAAAPRLRPALYQPEFMPLWAAALAMALGFAAAECCFNIKAMGELQ